MTNFPLLPFEVDREDSNVNDQLGRERPQFFRTMQDSCTYKLDRVVYRTTKVTTDRTPWMARHEHNRNNDERPKDPDIGSDFSKAITDIDFV